MTSLPAHTMDRKIEGEFFTAFCKGENCDWSKTVALKNRGVADTAALEHLTAGVKQPTTESESEHE